jgi:formylglycine-generating enzyme required for sulfatase activity
VAGKIFINYRRVESLKDAQHLKTLFDKTFGAKRVFLDVSGIDGGANWLQTLERQVAASEAMVVLIGKDWANLKDEHGNRRLDDRNDFVRFEISQALLRNLPILPVLIDGAPMPKQAQLPDNLMQLTHIQAMPLRAESFTSDAEGIAERLEEVLAKRRQRGVPVWGAGLGLVAALAAGVAAGPITLNGLGLSFPGVTLPGDAQLRADLAAAQNRVVTAESALKAAEQRLADAERATQTAQAAQQALLQRVATAEKERDGARKDAVANAKVTDLERKLASNPAAGRTMQDCADCPEMVVVPAGKFLMGSPKEELGRGDNEDDGNGRQVEVAVRDPLAVGRFAVTRGEFAAFIRESGRSLEGGCYSWNGSEWKLDAARSWRSPGFEQTDRHPVTCVNWADAKAYVDWLSKKTGKSYRLLSEAEREYVTRAATTTPFWWGNSISTSQANYDGNYTYGSGSKGEYRQKTVPVDTFAANPWGLYQVHGNVWDWVEDCYHKGYDGMPNATKNGGAPWITGCEKTSDGKDVLRVLRGGSWDLYPHFLRSAYRDGGHPVDRSNGIGFRVARTL